MLRKDLERMWVDMNNMFDTFDHDISDSLDRYQVLVHREETSTVSTQTAGKVATLKAPSLSVPESSPDPFHQLLSPMAGAPDMMLSINNGMMHTISEEPAHHRMTDPVADYDYDQESQSHSESESHSQNPISSIHPQRPITSDLFLIHNENDDEDEDELFSSPSSDNEDAQNSLLNDLSMQRMIYILSKYNDFLSIHLDSNDNGYDGMYQFINGHLPNYSTTKLLDDFHSVLFSPQIADDGQFEAVHQYLLQYMDRHSEVGQHALILESHFVDGHEFEKCRTDTQREAFYGKHWMDSREIVTLQILNRIYFYFVHSFDVGHRLQYSMDSGDMSTLSRRISEKRKRLNLFSSSSSTLSPSPSAILSEKRSKFMMDGDRMKSAMDRHRGDDNYNNNGNGDEDEVGVTQFGHRYYYWFEFTNKQWFIMAKFKSLKEELLSNNLYHLTPNQFVDLTEEARSYQKCRRCRAMNKLEFNAFSDDNEAVIDLEHIMALLLYTNWGILRAHFLETFYRRNEEESNVSLKSRHSNFAIFGRLLSESVQWFGRKVVDVKHGSLSMRSLSPEQRGTDDLRFFHGIDASKTLFHSTTIRICVPLSCSTNYNVICGDAMDTAKGMMLQLRGGPNARYFESAFLSKFVGEEEALFVAGDAVLILDDIIDFKMGYKFGKFLRGIDVIHAMMTGDWYTLPMDQALRRLVKELILYQLSLSDLSPESGTIAIPEYVRSLLHCYCIEVRKVTINWTAWNQEKQQRHHQKNGYVFLRRLLCHDLMLKLDVLYALFPNLESIHIDTTRHFHFHLEQMVLDGTMSFISTTGKQSALRQITIKKPVESRLSIREAIQQNQDRFDAVGWSIDQTLDKWKDKFLLIHKQ